MSRAGDGQNFLEEYCYNAATFYFYPLTIQRSPPSSKDFAQVEKTLLTALKGMKRDEERNHK